MPLEILQEDEASLRWRLVGDLDLATADVLVETVVPRIEEPDAAVALDLRELSFVDSSGIRALISIATRLAGGTLTLVAPSPPVAKVLQLVRADSFPNLRIEADG
ncbi:MAG TPA: STAS domain-containing protein [Actinomycetota bacterium]